MVGAEYIIGAADRVPGSGDIGGKGLAGVVGQQSGARRREFGSECFDLHAQQLRMWRSVQQAHLRREAVDQQHAVEHVFATPVVSSTPMLHDPVGLLRVGKQVGRSVDRSARVEGRAFAVRRTPPGSIEVFCRAQVEHRSEQRPLGAGNVFDRELPCGVAGKAVASPALVGRRQGAVPTPRLCGGFRAAERGVAQREGKLTRRPQHGCADKREYAAKHDLRRTPQRVCRLHA